MKIHMRLAFIALAVALAGCGGVRPTGPAGQASTTNVNPETGSRGGSGAAN